MTFKKYRSEKREKSLNEGIFSSLMVSLGGVAGAVLFGDAGDTNAALAQAEISDLKKAMQKMQKNGTTPKTMEVMDKALKKSQAHQQQLAMSQTYKQIIQTKGKIFDEYGMIKSKKSIMDLIDEKRDLEDDLEKLVKRAKRVGSTTVIEKALLVMNDLEVVNKSLYKILKSFVFKDADEVKSVYDRTK